MAATLTQAVAGQQLKVAHEAVTAPSSPTSSPSILLERHDYGHQSFPLHESSFFSLLAL